MNPHIVINGHDDHTPAHAPLAALLRAAGDLLDAPRDPACADLTIRPRRTNRSLLSPAPMATNAAWYDLLWTYPTLVADESVEAILSRADGDEPSPVPGHTVIRRAGVLPQPQPLPAPQRSADTDEITLDGLTAAQIQLMGGPDKALATLTARRDLAITTDRSTDVYDWDQWAAAALETIHGLTAPALTDAQRAQAATVTDAR